METMVKQYEIAVNNAVEISQTILDMEGGRYILVMFNELLQDLLYKENPSGAASVVRKLHEAAEVPLDQSELDEGNIAWIVWFAGALTDIMEEQFP